MELRLISTTYEGKERITKEQTIPFCDDAGREDQLINLYPQVTYQRMDGFGGAITDSAAYIYSLMNPEQKKQMLGEYFGQGKMKYRFVRIPVDSCDFSLSHYEADGDEADASFESFSFARVEKYILPMLADAEAAYGGRLEIMLSPWSPPAYMKTNGERNHGGKLKACYWKRWAEYICRYVEEYRSRGFNVTMLTLQNEPKAVQTWDSCIYTAQEEKIFLRDYVWPSLAEHNLTDIDIYIWDHNKERAFEWAETIIDAETDHMVGEILSDKLAGLTPCDTVDKIGICFAVAAFDIPIHCHSKAGNGDAVSGSAQLRISGQPTHDCDMIQHKKSSIWNRLFCDTQAHLRTAIYQNTPA